MLGRKPEPITEEGEAPKGFDAYSLSLGDVMRGERATMGKSLLDVQRELKIKATYIAAVENADSTVFETPGFIAGYVRSYAKYLGLDADWAYERFCEESGFSGVDGLSPGSTSKKSTKIISGSVGDDPIFRNSTPYLPVGAPLLSGVEPRAVGSVTVLLALIGLIGYGGWSVLQEVQRVEFAPVEQSPGLVSEVASPEILPSDAGQNQAVADFQRPSADALDRLYRPQELDVPVMTARDGPIASISPNSIGTLADDQDEALATSTLARNSLDAPNIPNVPENYIPAPTVQVVEAAAPDVVVFATRPAWIRVASNDGSVLFEKILDAGESYVLPQTDEPPVLRSGNSGSLFFQVQGKTYGPVGPGASVAKNVVLGVEAITTAYVEADPNADPVLAETLTAMAVTAETLGAATAEEVPNE